MSDLWGSLIADPKKKEKMSAFNVFYYWQVIRVIHIFYLW